MHLLCLSICCEPIQHHSKLIVCTIVTCSNEGDSLYESCYVTCEPVILRQAYVIAIRGAFEGNSNSYANIFRYFDTIFCLDSFATSHSFIDDLWFVTASPCDPVGNSMNHVIQYYSDNEDMKKIYWKVIVRRIELKWFLWCDILYWELYISIWDMCIKKAHGFFHSIG